MHGILVQLLYRFRDDVAGVGAGVVNPRFQVGDEEGGTRSRGRDAGCPAPPAQIRTCPLRHTAPTSGIDGRLRRPPYPTPACVTVARLWVRSVLW